MRGWPRSHGAMLSRLNARCDTGGMKISRPVAIFILALAIFMIVEWTMLGFNLADGHPTAFYVVHGILIAANIVAAITLAALVWRSWRLASRQQ